MPRLTGREVLTATPMNYHERRRTVRAHKAPYFQALWTVANYDEQTERSSTLPDHLLMPLIRESTRHTYMYGCRR